jgi:hypothetical protein
MIFLGPADLLFLDYVNVPVASVLRPEGQRHYVAGNINHPPCLCKGGRKFFEDKRGMWIARCPIDELEDILAFLRGDHANSSNQLQRTRDRGL